MIPDINSGGGLAAIGGFAYAAGGNEANIAPGLETDPQPEDPEFLVAGAIRWSWRSSRAISTRPLSIPDGACARRRWALRSLAVHPVIKDGTIGVAKVGWLGIVKTSPNIAAAHWFLNQYLDFAYQLSFSVNNGVVPVNKLAITKMGEDAVFAEMLQLDPKDIAKELRLDYSKANLSEWSDQWNRIVVRQ